VGVDPEGIVTLAAVPGDIEPLEKIVTLVSNSTAITQELRILPADPSQGAIGPDPSSSTAQDAQFHFGCTTGISFTFDTSTDKYQVQMHSPLLDSSGNVVYQAANAGSISAENFGTGCGKRGRLAFYNGWTGISQADWHESLFYKMGFNWEDLNPEAGLTDDPAGWLTSDALLDSTMDTQSNVAVAIPYAVLTERVTGPTSQLLADRYSARGSPGWLVECSLLPSTSATSWTGADGRNLSSIIGQATRMFSSLDFYHSSVGPIWRVSLPKGAPPIIAGSMRIRILKSDTAEEDVGIGQDSAVTVLVT
jgi:DMSO/TMAO reductase YedYZ molybdopterin-dependent catalytic subunit